MDNIITNANGMKVKVRVYDFGDKTSDRYTIIRYLVVARTRSILKE